MTTCFTRALAATVFAVLSQVLFISSAAAETLKVLTTGAFKQVVVAVAADYEKRTGRVILNVDGVAGAVTKRVTEGESFDVLVLTPAGLKTLASSGHVDASSTLPLAKVAIGVAVKQGAPLPALKTVEDFQAAVRNARKVALINPASGGSSGIYLEGLFQRMGMADEVKAKAVLVNGGLVAEKIVTGEADLAIHQISEILPVAGVTLVGPLPEAIQNYTAYAGAVRANTPKKELANAFLQLFVSAQGKSIIREKGMME
ncbi:MAG: ABC transporter substrate-binding protein [Betaproteobacteria bacterium]|nr:ABC transporter substrate-binding protein [Betaproteobacteria bacterium]